MKKQDKLETVRGSGNIFHDFGVADAESRQLKVMLAVQIAKVLDARKLTVRAAQEVSGVAAADLSRIRNARVERFTLDRLFFILGRLGQSVEVTVKFGPNAARAKRRKALQAA